MAVLCFLVLFAVQKTADLLRVDDSDRMEDAEQSYSGQGGKTQTNTEKTFQTIITKIWPDWQYCTKRGS